MYATLEVDYARTLERLLWNPVSLLLNRAIGDIGTGTMALEVTSSVKRLRNSGAPSCHPAGAMLLYGSL